MKFKEEKFFIKHIFALVVQVLIASCQDKKGCDCGPKEYYNPEATIQSPGFPDNYPDDCNCAYRIFTDRNISVSFSNFSLETSEDCRYDYLQFVFDASGPNPFPKRYCGNGLSKIEGGKLNGEGPLIIGFKSDDSDTLQGFRFTYKFELQGPDPCLSDPCVNAKNCSTFPGYYLCDCVDGYAGVNCEIDKDECLSYPCKNSGECIDAANSFTCECNNGYTGDFCEIKPDFCVSDPCLNGGLCIERGLDYVCSCPRDFMGEHCESEVPTPPPRFTITTAVTTTTITTVSIATTVKDPASSSLNRSDDTEDHQNQRESSIPNSNMTEGKSGSDSDASKSNDSDLFIIAIILFVVILLVISLGFGWNWWKRKNSGNLDLAIKVETPLKKRKSKSRKGKNNGQLSRTTSFNRKFMTLPGREKEMVKISEDIIVEEVADEPQRFATKLHPVTAVNMNAFNSVGPAQKNIPPFEISSHRNNNLPMTFNDPQSVSAIDTRNLNIATLTGDGLSSFPKNPFPNPVGSPLTKNKTLKVGHQNVNTIYDLPNVPFDSDFSMKNKQNRNKVANKEMMELSPEKMTDLVNPGLSGPKHMATSPERHGNGSLITSTYDPSETGYRPHMRINRDFPEYSPIQEESDVADQDKREFPRSKQKRPSQTFENILDEPELKRLRKIAKHFSDARTLDPDEKVHDWLKKTPKQKLKHQETVPQPESPEVKPKAVISRSMPANRPDEMSRKPNNSIVKDENTPRTIRQTKKGFKDNLSSFKITENKAKSLMDKLVKAPARSNHNVVGPGLAMSRENAFVGENF